MTYAIIRVGGKQYRVSEGERLLVDRLQLEESATFNPDVLFVGGNGASTATVTAVVRAHTLGPKIRIGKYRKRTGYRRHTGHRSKFSEIEIQSIAGARKQAAAKKAPAEEAAAETPAATTAHGVPVGYADMTVAQVTQNAKSWSPEELQAALEHEREHGARKGAIAALESAIARNQEEES
jgi:large subunit ribosomal protein L21